MVCSALVCYRQKSKLNIRVNAGSIKFTRPRGPCTTCTLLVLNTKCFRSFIKNLICYSCNASQLYWPNKSQWAYYTQYTFCVERFRIVLQKVLFTISFNPGCLIMGFLPKYRAKVPKPVSPFNTETHSLHDTVNILS